MKRLLTYVGVQDALKAGKPGDVAEAMYRSRYYEGFHTPDPEPDEGYSGEWPRKGWLRSGPLTKGETMNVLDYASALAKLTILWKESMNLPTLPDTSSNSSEKPKSWTPDIRPGEGIRDRVARIAREHSPMTVARDRVRLGTFLSSGLEKDPLLLARMQTSCGTYARACLLWAGCENPLLRRPYEIGTAITRLCQLAGVWEGPMRAWIPCRTPSGSQPKKGDIFRINTPGTNDDHVGVIVDVLGPWKFATAEGGQNPTGCDVGAFVRQFSVRGDRVFMGERQLQGWIDCEAIGLPESPTPAIEPVPAPEPVPDPAPEGGIARAEISTAAGALVVAGGTAVAAATAHSVTSWWFWASLGVVICVSLALVRKGLSR